MVKSIRAITSGILAMVVLTGWGLPTRAEESQNEKNEKTVSSQDLITLTPKVIQLLDQVISGFESGNNEDIGIVTALINDFEKMDTDQSQKQVTTAYHPLLEGLSSRQRCFVLSQIGNFAIAKKHKDILEAFNKADLLYHSELGDFPKFEGMCPPFSSAFVQSADLAAVSGAVKTVGVYQDKYGQLVAKTDLNSQEKEKEKKDLAVQLQGAARALGLAVKNGLKVAFQTKTILDGEHDNVRSSFVKTQMGDWKLEELMSQVGAYIAVLVNVFGEDGQEAESFVRPVVQTLRLLIAEGLLAGNNHEPSLARLQAYNELLASLAQFAEGCPVSLAQAMVANEGRERYQGEPYADVWMLAAELLSQNTPKYRSIGESYVANLVAITTTIGFGLSESRKSSTSLVSDDITLRAMRINDTNWIDLAKMDPKQYSLIPVSSWGWAVTDQGRTQLQAALKNALRKIYLPAAGSILSGWPLALGGVVGTKLSPTFKFVVSETDNLATQTVGKVMTIRGGNAADILKEVTTIPWFANLTLESVQAKMTKFEKEGLDGQREFWGMQNPKESAVTNTVLMTQVTGGKAGLTDEVGWNSELLRSVVIPYTHRVEIEINTSDKTYAGLVGELRASIPGAPAKFSVGGADLFDNDRASAIRQQAREQVGKVIEFIIAEAPGLMPAFVATYISGLATLQDVIKKDETNVKDVLRLQGRSGVSGLQEPKSATWLTELFVDLKELVFAAPARVVTQDSFYKSLVAGAPEGEAHVWLKNGVRDLTAAVAIAYQSLIYWANKSPLGITLSNKLRINQEKRIDVAVNAYLANDKLLEAYQGTQETATDNSADAEFIEDENTDMPEVRIVNSTKSSVTLFDERISLETELLGMEGNKYSPLINQGTVQISKRMETVSVPVFDKDGKQVQTEKKEIERVDYISLPIRELATVELNLAYMGRI